MSTPKSFRGSPSTICLIVLTCLVGGYIAACGAPRPTRAELPPSGPPSEKPTPSTPPSPTQGPVLPNPSTAPFPGTRWTLHGEPAQFGSIALIRGPLACGYHDLLLLTIGWPLGTVPADDRFARQYIRDRGNRFRHLTLADYEQAVELPDDAFDTGYRYGTDALWVSEATVDRQVYLVRGETTEQWPRVRELLACA
jgi:hypothetical protein